MSRRGDHGARLMTENDARYFAGIVDGEGWIDCRRRIKKCSNNKFYKCSSIHVEIQMNHKGVMEWLKEKAGFGTLNIRRARYKQNFDNWRWRCSFRDALYVCKLLWPYAQVKLHKIEQIIDHNEPEYSDHNVVSLEDYRNEKR